MEPIFNKISLNNAHRLPCLLPFQHLTDYYYSVNITIILDLVGALTYLFLSSIYIVFCNEVYKVKLESSPSPPSPRPVAQSLRAGLCSLFWSTAMDKVKELLSL